LKFINKETGLQLVIGEELVNQIADHGINKYPNEFGGLLLGRYLENNKVVSIEDSIFPKKYTSSRYFFERGSEGIKEMLVTKYNGTPSLIYVGEWHTHPDGPATPSNTDLIAMSELANDNNVLITNPVLMIMEVRKSNYKVELYFFNNNKLLRYEPIDLNGQTLTEAGNNNLFDDQNKN
jgi:proteasome lid subunit RPN8/RPN11